MLEHNNAQPAAPGRTVILGAAGFVGRATRRVMEDHGADVLELGRAEADLLAPDGADVLAEYLRNGDTLVVISAEAPCKDPAMLERNIRMMRAVCGAVERVPPGHTIYVSSDAVYTDSPDPLSETSPAEPGSLHGVMHLARELMLRHVLDGPLAILRPTLIYGAEDPHNGYGPNRFRRLAAQGQDIQLFGDGEERRDHIAVEDVAELIRLIAWHRSSGVLNAATGRVASFREIAEMVIALEETPVDIKGSPRVGPMPHNGYRPFDAAEAGRAFPAFRFTELGEGLARAHAQSKETQ